MVGTRVSRNNRGIYFYLAILVIGVGSFSYISKKTLDIQLERFEEPKELKDLYNSDISESQTWIAGDLRFSYKNSILDIDTGDKEGVSVSGEKVNNALNKLNIQKKDICHLKIHGKIIIIDDKVFQNWANLKSLDLKAEIPAVILDRAFEGCTSLIEFSYEPKKLKKIGSYAFSKTNYKEIEITAIEISEYAFSYINNLEKVVIIPEERAEYGKYIFYGCSELKTIYFLGNSDPQIDFIERQDIIVQTTHNYQSNKFGKLNVLKDEKLMNIIRNPNLKVNINNVIFTFNGETLTIEVNEARISSPRDCITTNELNSAITQTNYDFSRIRTVVFSGNNKFNIGESFMQKRTSIETLRLNRNIREFRKNAFQECTNLATLDIPEDHKVEMYGPYAFGKSGLTEVTINTNYLSNAFTKVFSLTTVRIINIDEQLELDQSKEVFSGCSKISTFSYCKNDFKFTGNEKVVFGVPNGVKVHVPSDYVGDKCGGADVDRDANIATSKSLKDLDCKLTFIGTELIIDGQGQFSYNYGISNAIFFCPCSFDKIETLHFIGKNNLTLDNNAFKDKTNIKKVIFENEGTVTFWNYVFQGCTNLISIELPEKAGDYGNGMLKNTKVSIVKINTCEKIYLAFSEMPSLTKVTINKVNNFIRAGAFADDPLLTNVVYCGLSDPAEHKGTDNIFSGTTKNVVIEVPTNYEGTKFGNKEVQKTASTTVVGSITYTIGNTEVKIEGSGESNKEAFNGQTKCPCDTSSIVKLVFSEGPFVITSPGFSEITTLTTVDMSAVTSVNFSESAFAGCSKLADVKMPKAVVEFGENSFSNTGITEIDIPANLVKKSAFQNCLELHTVRFNADGVTIEEMAFNNCPKLANIQFPENITKIGRQAFTNATITDLTFINVDTIEEKGLEYLNELVSVSIKSAKSIGKDAFYFDIKMKSFVYCGKSNPTAGKDKIFTFEALGNKFNYEDNIELKVPNQYSDSLFGGMDVTEVEKTASEVVDKTLIYLVEDTEVTVKGSGVLNKAVYDANRICPCASSEFTSLTLSGDGPFTIEASGFMNCQSLTTFSYSNSGKNLLNIKDSAFKDCIKLKTVNVSSKIGTIGKAAFQSTIINTIVIPEETTLIDNDCFALCAQLITVNIHAKNIKINNGCFYQCTALTDVYYCETAAPTHDPAAVGDFMLFPVHDNSETPKNITSAKVKVHVPFDFADQSFGEKKYGSLLKDSISVEGNAAIKDKKNKFTFKGTELIIDAVDLIGIGEIEPYIREIKCPCVSLDEVTILRFIGARDFTLRDNFFLDKVQLESVVFKPNGKVTFSNQIFQGCTKLSKIEMPEKLGSLGERAFDKTIIASLVIKSADLIHSEAFSGMKNLKTCEIHSFKKGGTIGRNAFFDCTNLNSLVFCGDDDPAVGVNLFIKTGGQSFAGDVKVEVPLTYSSLKFGEKVLTEDDKIAGVVTINGITYSASKTKLTVSGSGTVDKESYDKKVKCDCTSNVVTEIEFTGTNIETLNLIGFNSCSHLTKVTFSNTGTTTLNTNAFANCESLSSVTLPENIELIGQFALSNLDITTISIKNCKKISNCAFYNNKKLVSIILQTDSIILEYDSFYQCTALTSVAYCGVKPPERGTVPSGVTYGVFTYLNNNKNASRSDQVTVTVP